MAKKKQQRGWVYSPSSKGGTCLDAATKAQVEAKFQGLIDTQLKPKHVKPPPEDARFNYITDITLKWHGSTLFLVRHTDGEVHPAALLRLTPRPARPTTPTSPARGGAR